METTNGVPSQLRKVVLPAGQSPQGEHIFRRPGLHLAERYSLLEQGKLEIMAKRQCGDGPGW